MAAVETKAAVASVGFVAATLSFVFGCFKLFLISLSVGSGLVIPGIALHWYLKQTKRDG